MDEILFFTFPLRTAAQLARGRFQLATALLTLYLPLRRRLSSAGSFAPRINRKPFWRSLSCPLFDTVVKQIATNFPITFWLHRPHMLQYTASSLPLTRRMSCDGWASRQRAIQLPGVPCCILMELASSTASLARLRLALMRAPAEALSFLTICFWTL